MCKIGFIGAGNMAGAIIDGILRAELLRPAQIMVYNRSVEKTERFAASGVQVASSAGALVEACTYVVLSVKPQNFPEVLAEICSAVKPEHVFISIAAGISTAYIKSQLGTDTKVVRVMPNTPLLIAAGTSAISHTEPVTDAEFAFVRSIFAGAGDVFEISDDQMDAVIPLNGSSPAYIYLFAKTFVALGVQEGFTPDIANQMFCSTLIGSARMMLEAGCSHQELIDMVTSPKGTTFEGLQALERCGFKQALTECFHDTVRRAEELGK